MDLFWLVYREEEGRKHIKNLKEQLVNVGKEKESEVCLTYAGHFRRFE